MATRFLPKAAAKATLSTISGRFSARTFGPQAMIPIVSSSKTTVVDASNIAIPCGGHHHHQLIATRSFFFFEPKENHRIRDILVNPDSLGSRIKPGNLVDKFYEKTGNTRTVPVELAHGYFWMIEDLKRTQGKPTLSNPHLIPASNAETFPSLVEGVTTLSNTDEAVEIPKFFQRKNRSNDEHAQCTLVAISCRDHGFNMLSSWTKPFREAFEGEERCECVHLHLTEGWFSTNLLQSMIKSMVKKRTPVEEHDATLLCFSRNDLEEFRDTLRIHNVMSGYVFLLDGIGRIRFAGSGEASPEEVERLINFTRELTPLMMTERSKAKDSSNSRRSSSSRRKINH